MRLGWIEIYVGFFISLIRVDRNVYFGLNGAKYYKYLRFFFSIIFLEIEGRFMKVLVLVLMRKVFGNMKMGEE
jgi:hypothetical protein